MSYEQLQVHQILKMVTIFPLNMVPPLIMASPSFWDPGKFCFTIIFIKTPCYDILKTNVTLNMDHHDIIYTLPQELPYFSHLNFVKCM